MTESGDGVYLVEPQPLSVHLHLHRQAGVMYAVATSAVFVVVVLGLISYLTTGRWLMALVVTVFGLGITGFLAVLAVSILAPDLRVDSTGVSGRLDWRTPVEAGWDRVVVDAEEDRAPHRLRLQVDGQTLSLNAPAWHGFRRLVLLLDTDPAAGGSVTPEARAEIGSLLGRS